MLGNLWHHVANQLILLHLLCLLLLYWCKDCWALTVNSFCLIFITLPPSDLWIMFSEPQLMHAVAAVGRAGGGGAAVGGGTAREEPLPLTCVHPRSRRALHLPVVIVASRPHDSSGSTVDTFLPQDDLLQQFDTIPLGTISEDDDYEHSDWFYWITCYKVWFQFHQCKSTRSATFILLNIADNLFLLDCQGIGIMVKLGLKVKKNYLFDYWLLVIFLYVWIAFHWHVMSLHGIHAEA